MKQCLGLWKVLRSSKAYNRNLSRRVMLGLVETIENSKFLEETSISFDNLQISKFLWSNFKEITSKLKNERFIKEQVSVRQAQRSRCSRSWNSWKYAISDELLEKQRQKHRTKTWEKINNWVSHYHEKQEQRLDG